MSKKTVILIVEWCIAILFVFLFFRGYNPYMGSLTPTKAHELSERSYHYGPSKIVKVVPFGGNTTVYLGVYKEWFSSDTVIKRGLGWHPGGGVGGVWIDSSKPLTYSWSVSERDKKLTLAQFYGYVSDPEITTVVLYTETDSVDNKEARTLSTMSQEINEDRMFLFIWNDKDLNSHWKSIQGLDQEGKVVYEEKFN
ncbi:DUF5044 domain-containing protein [Paenibacillus anaericanus]|uniref:DUF5044 domain-containing protein n=1 Tax=Paenibacillus anaericanus TaxID=170367 RepID=A0A433Y885_9BACL|nr:DUF5044 domain-containing protein [Paenibacillus anaericanus]RUT45561.1 DUF5044 domain-containing protein [Paenibacillus anaericanus]